MQSEIFYSTVKVIGNRKTQARIPAQSRASFFPQKDFKFFKISCLYYNLCEI